MIREIANFHVRVNKYFIISSGNALVTLLLLGKIKQNECWQVGSLFKMLFSS